MGDTTAVDSHIGVTIQIVYISLRYNIRIGYLLPTVIKRTNRQAMNHCKTILSKNADHDQTIGYCYTPITPTSLILSRWINGVIILKV